MALFTVYTYCNISNRKFVTKLKKDKKNSRGSSFYLSASEVTSFVNLVD